MKVSIAGVTFRIKDDQNIRLLRPSGEVELKHIPFVHPKKAFLNDPLAVQVHWNGLFLGFLPAKSEARESFHQCKESGLSVTAQVKEYAYGDYDPDFKVIDGTFNNEHEGWLASVTLEVEAAVTATHYNFKEGAYLRTTCVTGTLNELGFLLPEYLYNWMMKFKEWKIYKKAIQDAIDDGNKIHHAMEVYLRDGVEHPDMPHGGKEFCSVFSVEYISSEQIVKDDNLKVAGRFDLFAGVTDDAEKMNVIVDYKRGKVLKFSYMLQSAYYCVKMNADGFWIVLFGTGNKCGYSVKKFTREDANELFSIFRALAFVAHAVRKWKEYKG